MTTATLIYTGTLVVDECPVCGTQHAIPAALDAHADRDHTVSIYCPLGHPWHYIGETEAEKERRLRKWAEDRAAAARARADQAEASLRTTKGHVTRLRRQVLVRLYLPLPMGAVGRILRTVSQQFPDAVVSEDFAISADPDLTSTEARRKAKACRAA